MSDEQFAAAFADAAAAYARGRPGYAPGAIDALIRELGLERRSEVVDLAAGTGKLTADLARRFDRVIAIEPLAEMREHVARAAPAVEALEGSAERMPVPDASADGVFVAQAFHWFDGPPRSTRSRASSDHKAASACFGTRLHGSVGRAPGSRCLTTCSSEAARISR